MEGFQFLQRPYFQIADGFLRYCDCFSENLKAKSQESVWLYATLNGDSEESSSFSPALDLLGEKHLEMDCAAL